MPRPWILLFALGLGLACNASNRTWKLNPDEEEEEEEDAEEPDAKDAAPDEMKPKTHVVNLEEPLPDAGSVTVNCDFHMIGFGITSPSDPLAGDDRVRAPTCIAGTYAGHFLRTQNLNATTCRGDGGAPLIRDGTSEIVGVLWGTALGPQGKECEPGPQNYSDFTSVAIHRDWIDGVLAENPE